MKLYTTKEFASILNDTKTELEITDLMEYVFINAVQIIKSNGASYYNLLAFAISEKLRLLEPEKV